MTPTFLSSIKSVAIALPLFILLDYLWLARLAKQFYLSNLAPLIKVENGSLVVQIGGAVMVYVIGILALLLYVDPVSKTPGQAFVAGALLGALLYGFYDFTNYATLHSFPLSVVIIDTLWGAFLFAMLGMTTAWGLQLWK